MRYVPANPAAELALPCYEKRLAERIVSEEDVRRLVETNAKPRDRVLLLVYTWNSFAGVAPFDELKPVKKFTNRKAAVARIWQAVARLSPDAAQPAADVAPAKGKGKKAPAKAPRSAQAQKGGATESRTNKKAAVIAMMKRRKGRDVGRDRRSHGLAEAHSAGLRQDPGEQGRATGRVLKERRRGARSYHIAK
jgi:hypothetical protein